MGYRSTIQTDECRGGWEFAPHNDTCLTQWSSVFSRAYGRFTVRYSVGWQENDCCAVFWNEDGVQIANYLICDDPKMELARLRLAGAYRARMPPSFMARLPRPNVVRSFTAEEGKEFVEAVLADKAAFLKAKRLEAKKAQEEEAKNLGLSLVDYKKKRGQERKERILEARAARAEETVDALLRITPHITRLKDAMARFEKACLECGELNMKNIDPTIERLTYVTKRVNGWAKYKKNGE